MGKTSIDSRFNIPGKIAWFTMEAPGFITLLYIMFNLPDQLGLDWRSLPTYNWLMAGLFVLHYLNRAVLYPLVLQPSISPIHPFVWCMALSFQLFNATCIGGWLAGYGPTTDADWSGALPRVTIGSVVFFAGLIGNIWHDDELRELRRESMRRQKAELEKKAKEEGKPVEQVRVDKVYLLPENGLFAYILYPHYLCEWIEWAGFWIIGGLHCAPARCFFVNEITTMTPRALQGWHWYVKKFGADKVGSRKAILPGLL
ncbi:hypothetical protein, variant [Verruconis gallopava]|nr:hypothetical protein, variant [Verruconis gallopava]KIW05207.1 hypothetical protein, variant [Verruconis gallopava]